MRKISKKYFRKVIIYMFAEFNINVHSDESTMIIQGNYLAILNSMFILNPKRLLCFWFKVSLPWGEGKIIEWLIEHIFLLPYIFIEFGVEDYSEANTRFLVMNRNWRGLIIDSSEEAMEKVKKSNLYWRCDLKACARFITRENIDEIFAEHGFSGEIGLLRVDVDGNDY